MENEEMNKYRKREFLKKINIVGVNVRVKKDKTQIVLMSDDSKEYTCKLEKHIKKEEFNKELGINVEVSEEKPVLEKEIRDYLPNRIKELAQMLKTSPSVEVYLIVDTSALKFDDEIKFYYTLKDWYIENMYIPKLDEDKKHYKKQEELKKNYEEYKKGKPLEI